MSPVYERDSRVGFEMATYRRARSRLRIASVAKFLAREIGTGAHAVVRPRHAGGGPELIRVSDSEVGADVDPIGPRVVLVHGYASRPTAWTPIVARLRSAGFANIWCLSYGCAGQSIPRLASSLVEKLGDLRLTPTHLIGH